MQTLSHITIGPALDAAAQAQLEAADERHLNPAIGASIGASHPAGDLDFPSQVNASSLYPGQTVRDDSVTHVVTDVVHSRRRIEVEFDDGDIESYFPEEKVEVLRPLHPSTWAAALAQPSCDICGTTTDDAANPYCERCWNSLHEQGRVTQFRDPSDGTMQVLVDGKEVL